MVSLDLALATDGGLLGKTLLFMVAAHDCVQNTALLSVGVNGFPHCLQCLGFIALNAFMHRAEQNLFLP